MIEATYCEGRRGKLGNLMLLTEINWDSIANLKRCSRCILPETFPFIQFDEQGLCNYCKTKNSISLEGRKAFEDILYNGCKIGEKPKILFPISGGRDSCYALHCLVKDFGVSPVAFTYDWGMVTDLARRNIERICRRLGVRHIYVTANIIQKRANIRKSVQAWIKRPHLGTIPLFMAGDKPCFYYANKLKKDLCLSTILLSSNPLERTDFKLGFCGINELYARKVYFSPKTYNKLRIAWFYAKEFLKNPSYINSSLLNTFWAYLSYYWLPQSFESIFDYIPWIESDVEKTLISRYGWETAPDTASTWRIGDGTAAFYNYIYLKVAGFTENDTFRSNQIRAGLLDRETALSRVFEENKPRLTSLAWYFDTIGMDGREVINAVNNMLRLY